jgi:hypothetical protein
MKPKPSLLSPRMVPSSRTTSMFTAPMRCASLVVSSTMPSARSLCGKVMLPPRKPSAGSARIACSSLAGWVANGI